MATYDPIAAVELENDVSVRPPHDCRKQPLAPARDPRGPSLTYLNFSGRLHILLSAARPLLCQGRGEAVVPPTSLWDGSTGFWL